MPEVAGSLWSVPHEEQLDAARRLQAAGLRRLHWDMTDGRFADAGGFTAAEAAAVVAATGLTGEAHIMAEEPLREVDAWAELCDLVIVHAESDGWQHAVDRISHRGAEPGLAISPATPISIVPAGMTVLCMTVTPGKAGSAFDDRVLAKVADLRAESPGRRIGLDGGVKRHVVERATQAGATWLVVGTDLFTTDGAQRWKDVLVGA